jgi:hypothetical protein
MNERIKELVRQAESTANEGTVFFGQEYTDMYMAKLAELIVRECALQCRHNDDMDRIEKHFGVEE